MEGVLPLYRDAVNVFYSPSQKDFLIAESKLSNNQPDHYKIRMGDFIKKKK